MHRKAAGATRAAAPGGTSFGGAGPRRCDPLRRHAVTSVAVTLVDLAGVFAPGPLEAKLLELCTAHGIPRPEANVRIGGYEVAQMIGTLLAGPAHAVPG